jgi:hypothetical protein
MWPGIMMGESTIEGQINPHTRHTGTAGTHSLKAARRNRTPGSLPVTVHAAGPGAPRGPRWGGGAGPWDGTLNAAASSGRAILTSLSPPAGGSVRSPASGREDLEVGRLRAVRTPSHPPDQPRARSQTMADLPHITHEAPGPVTPRKGGGGTVARCQWDGQWARS